jgi:hypothetical protein
MAKFLSVSSLPDDMNEVSMKPDNFMGTLSGVGFVVWQYDDKNGGPSQFRTVARVEVTPDDDDITFKYPENYSVGDCKFYIPGKADGAPLYDLDQELIGFNKLSKEEQESGEHVGDRILVIHSDAEIEKIEAGSMKPRTISPSSTWAEFTTHLRDAGTPHDLLRSERQADIGDAGLHGHWARVPKAERKGGKAEFKAKEGATILVMTEVDNLKDLKKGGGSKKASGGTAKANPKSTDIEDDPDLTASLTEFIEQTLAKAKGKTMSVGELMIKVLQSHLKPQSKACKDLLDDADFQTSGSWEVGMDEKDRMTFSL